MKNSMSISTQLAFFISTLNRWVFVVPEFDKQFFPPRRWMSEEFIDVLIEEACYWNDKKICLEWKGRNFKSSVWQLTIFVDIHNEIFF